MREIKFRAFAEHFNDWVYGFVWHRKIDSFNGSELEVDEWYMLGDSDDYVSIKPETLGQYTGLKDINGKEIYEGDIIQYLYENCDEDDRYVVTWDDRDLRFGFVGINIDVWMALEDMYDDYNGDYSIKVIGNIYDNPELIKE